MHLDRPNRRTRFLHPPYCFGHHGTSDQKGMGLEVVIPFLNWSSHHQCNLPNIKVVGKLGEAHNIEVVVLLHMGILLSSWLLGEAHLNSMPFYSIQILDHLVHLHSLLW